MPVDFRLTYRVFLLAPSCLYRYCSTYSSIQLNDVDAMNS